MHFSNTATAQMASSISVQHFAQFQALPLIGGMGKILSELKIYFRTKIRHDPDNKGILNIGLMCRGQDYLVLVEFKKLFVLEQDWTAYWIHC